MTPSFCVVLRFVIRRTVVRKDLIQTLPLPRRLLDYLGYKNCFSEQVESDSSQVSAVRWLAVRYQCTIPLACIPAQTADEDSNNGQQQQASPIVATLADADEALVDDTSL